MAEKTFFKLIIVVLVVINIATISYLWLSNKPAPGGPGDPGGDAVGFLTHELNLSPAQHDKLVALHDDFQEQTKQAHDHLRALHKPYFVLLRNENIDTPQLNRLVDSMNIYHKQLELLTFEQFKAIRDMCTPAQQQHFDEIVDETMRFIGPLPPRKDD
ncbi:MAG TPA: periplasmic heavy metal sensor [Chitinophagaceae bacterium]|nr:periplasmic heavy metal sensor [Chitinophagaceae bacterium]